METTMSAEQFEEHVHRQCVKIIRAIEHGNKSQAEELTAELSTLAVTRMNSRPMERAPSVN